MRQLVLVQFADTLLDVVIQNKVEKFLLPGIVVREYPAFVRGYPFFKGNNPDRVKTNYLVRIQKQ